MKANSTTRLSIAVIMLLSTVLYAQAQSISAGDIIITEYMANPAAVSDANGEYIQLYNPTANTINLSGFHLMSATDTVDFPISGGAINIFSQGYFLIGRNTDISMNGGITPDIALPLALVNASGSLSITASDYSVIDMVTYLNSQSGISANLSLYRYNAVQNDDPSNWCASTGVYGDGDFGTPKTVNISCGLSGIDDADNLLPFTVYQTPDFISFTAIPGYQIQGQIILSDINGRLFWSASCNTVQSSYQIRTASLPAGIYFIEFLTSAGHGHHRFVKV